MYVIRLPKREIAGSLASVYFCGGDSVEDVTSHMMPHLSLHPTLRTCSSDTILRAISELATANTTYTSDTGKSYDFNTATKLNRLLLKALLSIGQLMAGASSLSATAATPSTADASQTPTKALSSTTVAKSSASKVRGRP